MRIISQDGMFDYPYEGIFIGISQANNTNSVMVWSLSDSKDYGFCMAKYSTKEIAMEAMRRLRSQYQYVEKCTSFNYPDGQQIFTFQFPPEDEIKMEI